MKIKTLPLPYLPHFHLHASISFMPHASITPLTHTNLHQSTSATGLHGYSTRRAPQLLHIPHSPHVFTVTPHSFHSTQIYLCCRLHMSAFTHRPPHAVPPTRLDLFILTMTFSLFNFLITLSLFCILGFV